jgi:hypothetical protein
VLAHAAQPHRTLRRHHARPFLGFGRVPERRRWRARRDDLRAGEILAGQRLRIGAHGCGRIEGDDLPAALAGSGAKIEQPVRRQHDLRVVFHDHQRVSGVAQTMHDLRDALHVARMQADRGLIEHEQRIHQRGAERGGQIDALDLAAGQSARLTIEREVAEADLAQIGEPRAYLA